MIGFNRRFSPILKKTKEFFSRAGGPMAINYRINAGYIPPEHWIQDPETGAGRIIGEVCHFVDLCTFLTGSEIKSVHAERLDQPAAKTHAADTLVISIKYTDGSIASISYFSNGDSKLSKERIEVFCESSCVIIDDFKNSEFISGGKVKKFNLRQQDKGQKGQIEGYIEMLKTGDALIPPEELFSVTDAVFRI
jgi:predicted dehydrogenase